MKRILMICSMLAIYTNAPAQTESDAMYANKVAAKSNDNDNAPLLKSNEFDHTEIAVDNGVITFSGLPQEEKTIWALVTNPEGESIKGVKINQANNVIDLHRLPGGMYFVTLVYRNASKKGFVVHL